MKHRIAFASTALAVPLFLGAAANAQAAPAVPADAIADSGSALLNTDLAAELGTGSGRLARALSDAGSGRAATTAEIAGSGSADLASTGSGIGNDVLTSGSAQALLGPNSAWSNFWMLVGNSGSGRGWLQGAGSSGLLPRG
ncbi:hypothetical protein ABZ319_22835 [Nocardia sp. NPDC005978]|uniref:hypothetical protein n=1 Tax=Nocardia sp. NPDC005978 TaxID=3156725 RepID=UPI0033B83DB8